MPPSPAKSPKKADPSHNYPISKDSQSESQKEIVPNRPSAKTVPATSLLPSGVYSVQGPRRALTNRDSSRRDD